ncbi:MAG TPA: exosortase/archaeosortase family protein [Verrucomicrobiota bacterium]|nr:exosortase/archaeosortase family protein [Verrucomicrobiota bacterium]
MPRPQPLLLLAPAFLAMAWLISRAQWFWRHNPDLQFGWIVVLLCGYLFWEAWQTRPEVHWRLRAWAVLIGLAGLGLLFVVQIYQAFLGANAASTVGLALGVMLVIVANLGVVFGWAGIRDFGMAFAFILIAMPMPSAVQGPVVGGLQSLVARFNVELLNLIGIPAHQVGSLIHLPNGTVGIDEACSGVRSLQSTIMAAIFIGYVSLKRNSLRLILFGAGVILAIVGNIGRSLYLSLMAHWRGMDAIEKVHDAAGWSVLAFTAAGVVLLSWMISRAEKAVQTAAAAQAQTDDD